MAIGPRSAPTFLLTEARSWANVTSRKAHLYRNGHQACTSCCLAHCLSSFAGAHTPDCVSRLFVGKRSATSTSHSQNDCSTSATTKKQLKGWHALTVNHKLQRTTAQALTCSGRDSRIVSTSADVFRSVFRGHAEHLPDCQPSGISAPGSRHWVSGIGPH